MRTRSHNREMVLEEEPNSHVDKDLKTDRPTLPASLLNSSLAIQRNHVKNAFKKFYNHQEAKQVQVDTSVELINGNNVFVLSGTGYGKSRIPELFAHLFDRNQRAVVVILNPLDALGDNQVLEKTKSNLTSINLTKTSFTNEAICRIKDHYYRFIYLSPEFFLNNTEFLKIYYSSDFQKHLVLKVVDEAHVVYSWGLVASGVSKHSQSHNMMQDMCEFRPSYGNLGRALMATDKVPLLLLSATCRPIAIQKILSSLSILPENIRMIKGELARKELRWIRMYMTRPLETLEDLIQLIPHQDDVSDKEMIRTLIYSGTQNLTWKDSKTVHSARGNPSQVDDGNSSCCRRYHAAIGPCDKLTRAKEYGEGKYPIISCTNALGLGQDWSIVDLVIIIRGMDPDVMIQMGGRGGRGNKGALVIMLVEPFRSLGQNSISDFETGTNMTDDDRTSALRITPVCLRVALTSDTRLGVLPLTVDDSAYVDEKNRQDSLGFPTCRCSNCDQSGAIQVIHGLKNTNRSNFHQLLNEDTVPQNLETPNFLNQVPILVSKPKSREHRALMCDETDTIRDSGPMIELVGSLVEDFDSLFVSKYPNGSSLIPFNLFNYECIWRVVKNYATVVQGEHLREIMGSQPIRGTFNCIIRCIQTWMSGSSYRELLEDQQAKERADKLIHDTAAEILANYMESQRVKENKRKDNKEKVKGRKRLKLQKDIEKKERSQRLEQREIQPLNDVTPRLNLEGPSFNSSA